jgi:hypothetical protein
MKKFKDIAGSIRGFMSAHRNKSLKSGDMLQALAGASESAASLRETLDKVKVQLDGLNTLLQSNQRPANKQCQEALASYQNFLKIVASVSNTRKYDKLTPFQPIRDVISLIESDLNLVMDQLDTIFSSDIAVTELRVSHAYVMGYVTLTQKLIGFTYGSMALLATYKSSDAQMPRWILRDATNEVEAIAEFVAVLILRSNQRRKTIITDIQDIRQKREADILLMSNGTTLDAYVEEHQFSRESHIAITSGMTFNPAVWISSVIIAIERYRLDLRRKQAEFIVIRMAILEMELSEVDPKDPEYQKKRKIIDNYGNMLSTIRKKIDDVESRV